MYQKNEKIACLRNIGAQDDIEAKRLFVGRLTTNKDLTLQVEELQSFVGRLTTRIKLLESILLNNKKIETAFKLQQIKELCELNEKVTVSVIKRELKLNARNCVIELMKEASRTHDLYFFKGCPGQESFLSRKQPENKAMTAYAETYYELINSPIGTSITESAIAHKFELNGQELQSVLSHLARHREIHIICPMSRKGCRRVKRVQ
ncbi:MAG: hypothetical protein AB1467_06655 [Candidatus Diapherotrites archaeon]